MPSSIQYKKIYIDSKYRSADSNSSSDFKVELPETIAFHKDTCFYLDDIAIPHSFESILDNINNKLYFKVYKINVLPEVEYHIIATIEPGNYTGVDLAAEIQTEMNSFTQTATTQANMFTCAYVAKTNKITITCNSNLYAFRIITQIELKTTDWTGTAFDRNKPNDMNEV